METKQSESDELARLRDELARLRAENARLRAAIQYAVDKLECVNGETTGDERKITRAYQKLVAALKANPQ